MPRIIAMSIWGVLTLIGVLVIVFAPGDKSKPGFAASRFLPRNTLLLASELAAPGYTNRYVVAPKGIRQGVALQSDDVADQPVLLEVSPVKLLLTLPIFAASVTAGVNAGKKIRLCGKAPTSFGDVTVQAVRCDPGEAGGNCAAIVELPGSAAADVAVKALKDEASTKELRLSATCD